MTVRQVMASRAILSAVPYAVKAEAVRSLLQGEVTPQVPASILRWHPQAVLYLDRESSALVDPRVLARHRREADQG
jgi:glucosamine-6-phosphate deaminase